VLAENALANLLLFKNPIADALHPRFPIVLSHDKYLAILGECLLDV
jgi:hypothetical protein